MANSSIYPQHQVEVVRFFYVSDLHLTRKIEKVRTRDGRDADYVVGSDFRVMIKVVQLDTSTEYKHEICVPKGDNYRSRVGTIHF